MVSYLKVGNDAHVNGFLWVLDYQPYKNHLCQTETYNNLDLPLHLQVCQEILHKYHICVAGIKYQV